MTEKRYSVEDRWIKDNRIDNLLNINFNTITDAMRCCDLLNAIENKRNENGKIATNLLKENEQLKKLLECSREEANDYCEELMGKDEFIRLYKRQRDEIIEENERLKKLFKELHHMTQYDVDNGIKVYPKKVCEYLANAIKELSE